MLWCYPSVDIEIRGHSAVGEDGASLPEAEVRQTMAKFSNAYLDNVNPKTTADFKEFLLYLREFRGLIIGEVQRGSLLITVRCTTLEILENLWQAYKSGELNEAAERYLINDELLKEYELREFKFITVIDEEEYKSCKEELTDLEGNYSRTSRKRTPSGPWQSVRLREVSAFAGCISPSKQWDVADYTK